MGSCNWESKTAPPIGTVVRVVPNHVCTVVNLFDHYDVVSNGDVVGR